MGPRLVLASVALLLVTSGLVRAWQDVQLVRAREAVETAPVSLASLPRDLGRWVAKGEDREIDRQTQEIAGARSYLSRIYCDEQTGTCLSLLIVFGPAERIVGHTPLVCMPAVGYEPAGPSAVTTVSAGDLSVPFSTASFSKPSATEGPGERQETYFAFRHAGVWSADGKERRKQFRSRPAMYKVQVQRLVGEAEAHGFEKPIESFLAELLPELEKCVRPAKAAR